MKRKFLLTLLAVGCGGLLFAASPWESWRLGYTTFEKGNRLREKGDYVEALASFRESRDHYLYVQKNRPDWNQNIIQTRIDACEKEISDIQRLLERTPAAKPPAVQQPPAAQTTTPAVQPPVRTIPEPRVPAVSGTSDIAKLRQELGEEKVRLFEERRKLREVTSELEELKKESARNLTAISSAAALELRTLRQELAREKAKLLEEEKKLLDADTELATLRQRENERKNAAAASSGEVEKLRRELAAAQAKLLEGEKKLLEANTELAALRKGEGGKTATAASGELEKMRRESADLQAKLLEERKKLLDVNTELAALKKREGDWKSGSEAAAAELDKLRQELTGEKGKRLEEQKKLLEATTELAVLRKSETENRAVAAELATLRKELATAKRELFEEKQKLFDVNAEFAKLREEAARLRTAGADLTDLRKLRQELADGKQKLFEANAALEEAKKLDAQYQAATRELTNLLREQRIQKEKYDLLEKRCAELEKKGSEPDSRLAELQKQLVEERLQADLVASRLKLAETNLRKQEEEAVGLLALRKKAEATVVQRAADVTRLERELEQAKAAATENVTRMGALTARLAALDQAALLAAGKLTDRERELAALKRQLDEALKTGGGSSELANRLVSENRALEKRLEESRALTAAAEKKLLAAETLRRERETEFALLEDAIRRHELTRNQLEAELTRLRKEQELGQVAAERTAVELKNLRERSRRLETDLESWVDRAGKLEGRLATRNSDDFKAFSTAEKARAELAARVEKLEADRAELEKRNQELARLQTRFAAEAGELRTAQTRLQGEKVGLEQLLKTAVESEEKLRAGLTAVNAELLKAREEVRTLDANFTALKSDNPSKTELANLRVELERMKREVLQKEQLQERLAAEQRLNQRLSQSERALKEEVGRLITAEGAPRLSPQLAGAVTAAPVLGTPDELLAAGKKAAEEDNRELAAWNYRAVLEQEPMHGEAAGRLGRMYFEDENYERALPLLTVARIASPESLPLVGMLATSLNKLEKYGNALEVLEQPLTTNPNVPELLVAHARALAGSGRVEPALRELVKAGVVAPSLSAVPLETARILLQAGRENEAAGYYQSARLLGAPPDLDLEPRLGQLLDERREVTEFMTSAAREAEKGGDWTSALWYYQELVKLDPASKRYPVELAFTLYKLDRPAEAEESLGLPHGAPAENFLLRSLLRFRAGDREGALQNAREAKKTAGGAFPTAPLLQKIRAEYQLRLAGDESELGKIIL